MESSANYNLLSKFTKLRKKPQQPLTDLTELYGKIANETIYFLKLEERKDYKGALQGWKALNTDVMYHLTVIEHEYPNVQSYTREETNIKSGVRELYHKSLEHLDRVKELYAKESEKRKIGEKKVQQRNTEVNGGPSFNRKPPMLRGNSSGPSRKFATTLRDRKLNPPRKSNQALSNDRSGSSNNFVYNKVNFTPSKPLIKVASNSSHEQNTLDKSNIREEKNLFEEFDSNSEGFDDKLEIIDLTQDSEEDEQDFKSDILSPKSDHFEFDVDDYYGNFEGESETDEEKVTNFLESNIRKLSIQSPPLVPFPNISAPELPTVKAPESPALPLSEIMKIRPPIPTLLPPSLIDSPPKQVKPSPVPRDPPPIPNTGNSNHTGSDAHLKSAVPGSSGLYKSKSNITAGPNTSRKLRPSTKALPASNLKATKSTPALSTRPKIVTSSAGSDASTHSVTNAQTATTAAKRVLNNGIGINTNKNKTNNAKKQQQRQELTTSSNSKVSSLQSTSAKRPMRTKKKIESNSTLRIKKSSGNCNSKSNSISSVISGSSTSSASSSATQTREKQTAASDAAGAPLSDPDMNRESLKEALEDEIIESLQGVDKAAAKQIFAEIVVHGDEVHWEDIAGLESAKSSLKEAVVYPFLRPDLFRGLREPVRGMLLFGPPGTGKTMLARAVATESHSTFFSISASSLTSKYLGESEKLVRALFAVAKKLSPSIVFVDEIDSIMGSRNNEGENESSRRIKNEFLIQWSSLSSAAAGASQEDDDERVLVLAATNLPWSIDEAARRRFVRRQYIPLPEPETRSAQLKKLLSYQKHTLTDNDFIELLTLTDGFSGSDLTSLAKDAAMGPLRELGENLLSTPTELIRPIALVDFKNSLNYIKPSVSQEGLIKYEDWAAKFGSSGV